MTEEIRVFSLSFTYTLDLAIRNSRADCYKTISDVYYVYCSS